jgi:hypothetical protein
MAIATARRTQNIVAHHATILSQPAKTMPDGIFGKDRDQIEGPDVWNLLNPLERDERYWDVYVNRVQVEKIWPQK